MDSMMELKKIADAKYYDEGVQIMPDEEYDVLVDMIDSVKGKKNKKLICAKPGKVNLPIQMWSLDKKKEYKKPKNRKCTKSVISDKLDGVSCLIVKNHAYTRGNGIMGFDITRMAAGLIPKNLPENFAFRGELVVKKSVNIGEFSNRRTFVCSFVNRNEPCAAIEFVAYEMIAMVGTDYAPSVQMVELKKYFPKVVRHEILEEINDEILSVILSERIEFSEYDIDGIVISYESEPERKARDLKKNPKWSFAYKKNQRGIETKVIDIEWNRGKTGGLTPVLIVEPVKIDGSEIRRVTGHNASHLEKIGAGVGAIVEIIKSGKIIPHVSSVILKSSDFRIPSVEIDKTASDSETESKKIQFFAKTLKISGMGPAKSKAIFETGYGAAELALKGYPELQKFTKNDEKIKADLEAKMKSCSETELAVALGLFGSGVGIKKAEKTGGTDTLDDIGRRIIKEWKSKWNRN